MVFCDWIEVPRSIALLVPPSRSNSRWEFYFHYYVLTIYVCLFWLLELIVFYSLVRRGYIRKVSVQLVPKYFSRDCSTDSISCSEQKKRKKTILKQDSKLRKEGQNVTVVANPPGSSSLRCCTAITPLSLRCLSSVAPLSHRYCYAVAPLSLRCCSAAVAPLLLRCRTAFAPLLFHCRSAAVAPAVDTQSHRYRSTVAPLLSLLLSLRSRSCYRLRCCSVVVPLLHRCCSAIAYLSLCCRFCWSVADAVAPAVATLSLLLSLLCSLTVVASRGRIRVTVFIGDFQARVSSSSEGCSTLQKTVKVEAY